MTMTTIMTVVMMLMMMSTMMLVVMMLMMMMKTNLQVLPGASPLPFATSQFLPQLAQDSPPTPDQDNSHDRRCC